MDLIKAWFFILLTGLNKTGIDEKSWIPFTTNKADVNFQKYPQLIFKKEPVAPQLRLAFYRILFNSNMAYVRNDLLRITRHLNHGQRDHFVNCLLADITLFLNSTLLYSDGSMRNSSHTFLFPFHLVYKQSINNANQIALEVHALLKNEEFRKVFFLDESKEENTMKFELQRNIMYDLKKTKVKKKDFLMWAAMPIYLGFIDENDPSFVKKEYYKNMGLLFGLEIKDNPFSNINDGVKKGTHHYLIEDFRKMLKSYENGFDKALEKKAGKQSPIT